MNFQPLFTTSRVVTSIYRIASTTVLLVYLAKRIKEGRTMPVRNRIRYRPMRAEDKEQ